MRRRFSNQSRENNFINSLYENRYLSSSRIPTQPNVTFLTRREIETGNTLPVPNTSITNREETLLINIPRRNANLPIKNDIEKKDSLCGKLAPSYKKEVLHFNERNIDFNFKDIFILYLRRCLVILYFSFRIICYISSYNTSSHFFQLRQYFNLVFYKASAELNFIMKKIDEQRTKLFFRLEVYHLPSENLSSFKRLFNHFFYSFDKKVFYYLLNTQLSLCSLIFFKMDLFFIVIFLLKKEYIFYLLLSFEDNRFLLLYFNLKKNLGCMWLNLLVEILSFTNLKDKLFRYFLFVVIISREIIQFEKYSDYYPLIWFFSFLNVYFHSLDIFKLQNTFIRTKLHLLFSPATFILFFYSYMIISLMPLYLVFSFFCGCYIPLVSCFTFIFFLGALSTFIHHPISCIFIGLFSCLMTFFTKSFSPSLTKILEIIFLPASSYKLVRERSFTALCIYLCNLYIFFLMAIYKLSRINNKVE